MKYSILLAILLLTIGCNKDFDLDENLIENFELQSQFEETVYEIRIGLPADYNTNNTEYGFIVVLDGDDCFEPTTHYANKTSAEKAKENVIVVGIMNFSAEGRKYNYTPPELDGDGGGGK